MRKNIVFFDFTVKGVIEVLVTVTVVFENSEIKIIAANNTGAIYIPYDFTTQRFYRNRGFAATDIETDFCNQEDSPAYVVLVSCFRDISEDIILQYFHLNVISEEIDFLIYTFLIHMNRSILLVLK